MTTSSTIEAQLASASDNTSQLEHWLEEYSEIVTILPVLTGLLVTTRLQLRGGNALLANIAIAAITRQVIVQLKKQVSHPISPPAKADAATAVEAPAVASNGEDYTIVHSVPGRIRLQIPRLQSDALYTKRLEKLLLIEDNVLGVRINRPASSLVIHYNSANLTELDLGMRLLNLLERAEQIEMES